MTDTPADTAATRLVANLPLMFTALLIVDSLHFVFARALLPHLPPEMSAFLLLGVAAIEVGAYQAARGRVRLAVLREHLGFFATIGVLVAASTVINYAAVAFVDPGTASLLGKASVVFALGLSLLWLRERLRANEVAGAALTIVGVLLISFQPGDYLRLGSLLILLSTFFYALHTAVVKRYGEGIAFGDFFLFRIASIAFFLLIFAAVRQKLVWPDPTAWLLVIVAGTVDVVISRGLYYLSLRRMPMSIHTIILTLSPVVTILWSLVLFGVVPSLISFFGGALVVGGVALVTLWRRP